MAWMMSYSFPFFQYLHFFLTLTNLTASLSCNQPLDELLRLCTMHKGDDGLPIFLVFISVPKGKNCSTKWLIGGRNFCVRNGFVRQLLCSLLFYSRRSRLLPVTASACNSPQPPKLLPGRHNGMPNKWPAKTILSRTGALHFVVRSSGLLLSLRTSAPELLLPPLAVVAVAVVLNAGK